MQPAAGPRLDEGRVVVSFPRGTWIVLAIFGLLMLATLGGQLALVHNQRDIARQQRKLAARQLNAAEPFFRETSPLVKDLRQSHIPDRLASLAGVVGTLQEHSRLSRLLRSAITVLGSIRSTGLVAAAARAARLVPELGRTQRKALEALRQALSLQRQALQLNRQTLATAQQTLQAARDADAHAASLDRKLGGQVPPQRAGR